MNILHVTAQKPFATGSGIYMTKLATAFADASIVDRQGILCAAVREDRPQLQDERIQYYPVFFGEGDLPFPVFGMSDVMPYESSLYKEMTSKQCASFKKAFLEKADEAVSALKADVIICHHLYLLTALIREHFPGLKVYAFCHNTDLIQFRSHELAHDLILGQMERLDGIFALHAEQKRTIQRTYGLSGERVHVVGAGYDPEIFNALGRKGPALSATSDPIRLVFAGKLSEAKGAISLLRAMRYLPEAAPGQDFSLTFAGTVGDEAEEKILAQLAEASPYLVDFPGSLSQPELAELYRESDLFVLPSRSEGLPLSVIEALACGLGALMTDLPGMREALPNEVLYLERGENEELFDRRLAEAIAGLALRSERIAGGASMPNLTSFTWKALAERVREILHC